MLWIQAAPVGQPCKSAVFLYVGRNVLKRSRLIHRSFIFTRSGIGAAWLVLYCDNSGKMKLHDSKNNFYYSYFDI